MKRSSARQARRWAVRELMRWLRSRGQKIEEFASEEETDQALAALTQVKRRRGYRDL